MYLLIIFWLNGTHAVTLAQYESFTSAEACETRLTEALNIEVRRAIERKRIDLPFMRCVQV